MYLRCDKVSVNVLIVECRYNVFTTSTSFQFTKSVHNLTISVV